MKDVINGKLYNTDNSILIKYVVKKEDLGNGYTRYIHISLYGRVKSGDFFLYVNKIATNPRDELFDTSESIYPVSEEFAAGFSHKYNEDNLMFL